MTLIYSGLTDDKHLLIIVYRKCKYLFHLLDGKSTYIWKWLKKNVLFNTKNVFLVYAYSGVSFLSRFLAIRKYSSPILNKRAY